MKDSNIDWHHDDIMIIMLKYGYEKLKKGDAINQRIFKMLYLTKYNYYTKSELEQEFENVWKNKIHFEKPCTKTIEDIINANINEKFKQKGITNKQKLIDTLFYKVYEDEGGNRCNNNKPGHISPNRYFQLLEYKALEHAKKSSQDASWYARAAIFIAGLGFFLNVSPDSYLLNLFSTYIFK